MFRRISKLLGSGEQRAEFSNRSPSPLASSRNGEAQASNSERWQPQSFQAQLAIAQPEQARDEDKRSHELNNRVLVFSAAVVLAVLAPLSPAYGATCDPVEGFNEISGYLLAPPDVSGRFWFPETSTENGPMLNAYDLNGVPAQSIPAPFHVTGAATGADGSLIVQNYYFRGGTPTLARINAAGSADQGFGNNGSTEGYQLPARALPDGSVVASGCGNASLPCWVRLNQAGALDTSFGNGGMVKFGDNSVPEDMFATPDGFLTRVHQGPYGTGTSESCTLVHVDSSGRSVTDFGSGTLPVNVCGSFGLLLPDHEGGAFVGEMSADKSAIEVTHLDAAGQNRSDFGVGGKVTVPAPQGRCILGTGPSLLQPDGKLIVSFATYLPDQPVFGTVVPGCGGPFGGAATFYLRLNVDGSPDDGSGADATPGDQFCTGGHLQADGFAMFSLYLAAGRLYGGGSTGLGAREFENFAVLPEPVAFPPASGVIPGALVISASQTISGLGEGIAVPAVAMGGEIARNGEGDYHSFVWVKNGDQITVRHTAAAEPGTDTRTVVRVGGVSTAESPYVGLGAYQTEFVSTTRAAPHSGGGGAIDLAALLGFGLALLRRRR